MNLGPAFQPPDADAATCSHPAHRKFAWFARDDRAKEGKVLCIVCMACCTVLRGAYREDEAAPATRNQVATAYKAEG